MRVLCASRINSFKNHKDGILADSPAEQDVLTLRRRVHGASLDQRSRAIFEMRNRSDLFPSRRLCYIPRKAYRWATKTPYEAKLHVMLCCPTDSMGIDRRAETVRTAVKIVKRIPPREFARRTITYVGRCQEASKRARPQRFGVSATPC